MLYFTNFGPQASPTPPSHPSVLPPAWPSVLATLRSSSRVLCVVYSNNTDLVYFRKIGVVGETDRWWARISMRWPLRGPPTGGDIDDLSRPTLIRSFGRSRGSVSEGEGGLRKVCLLRMVLSYRNLQYNIDTTGLVLVRYR